MSNFRSRFENRKKEVRVLILGPYGDCKTKLETLRDYLKTRGYGNSKLVADFPDVEYDEETADTYFLVKSKDCIKEWAEIILFVFDEECNEDSVLAEFYYTVESVNHKCHLSTILCSTERYFGSLLRGAIQINRINNYEYKNIDELTKKGYAAVFNTAQRRP